MNEELITSRLTSVKSWVNNFVALEGDYVDHKVKHLNHYIFCWKISIMTFENYGGLNEQ